MKKLETFPVFQGIKGVSINPLPGHKEDFE
jgi:hypothetical protein